LTEKNSKPASAFTLFCVEVQMLHHYQSCRSLNSWLLPLCKCLCHRWMWYCQCLLSWTYTLLKCKMGALSVLMPSLSSGMPDVLQKLHDLSRTWSARLHCRPIGNQLFCLWTVLFWTMKRYVQVSPDESLSKTQSENAGGNLLSTATIFQRLAASNVGLM